MGKDVVRRSVYRQPGSLRGNHTLKSGRSIRIRHGHRPHTGVVSAQDQGLARTVSTDSFSLKLSELGALGSSIGLNSEFIIQILSVYTGHEQVAETSVIRGVSGHIHHSVRPHRSEDCLDFRNLIVCE